MYMTQIETDGYVQFACTSAPKALCFICGSRKGRVINFTQESVINCRNLLEARSRKDRKLKFSNLLIPLDVSHYDGYHQKCFDAFSNLDDVSSSTAEAAASQPSTSKSNSEKNSMEDDSKAITCFFCEKKDVEGKKEMLCKMTKKMLGNLTYHAEVIGNVEMYDKFEELRFEDFEKESLYFHASCKRQFECNSNSIKPMSQKKPISQSEDDKMKAVYSELCLYVQERILKKREFVSMSSLALYYKNRFDRKFKESTVNPADLFITNEIETKLLDTFKGQLHVITKEGLRILTLSDKLTITDRDLEKLRRFEILEKAAHILRDDISNMKSDNRSIENMTPDKLKEKLVYPKSLKDFYETLLTAMSRRKNQSVRCTRLSDSFTQDLIYAVLKGHLKTQKHISIAFTLKGNASNTTRAKQMVNILNKHGHCCSYAALQKMERKFGWRDGESDDEKYNGSDPGSDCDI